MSEVLYDRLKENLESLKMRNTLEILDNYLERAIKDELNIADVLDHIFSEEARSKRQRAYEKQIQMSGFPIKKGLEDFDFSFHPSLHHSSSFHGFAMFSERLFRTRQELNHHRLEAGGFVMAAKAA